MTERYMGQIMAECDCQHYGCAERGYCMAERIEAMQAYIDAAEDVFDYELIFARKPKWTRLQEARDKLKEVMK